jgi:formyl-CoA transferase
MVLGDFGADVIKVEHPAGGDPLRDFGRKRNGVPLFWQQLARNKRSVTLALNKPSGQDLFRRLIRTTQADVVIETFRPGTFEKWGLGYDQLAAERPGLVLVRISGFGQTGPYRERPGFGTLAEAMSGFSDLTGQPDGPPTLPPIALADSVAALYAAFGLMVALRERDRSGRGQEVDVSLLESLFSLHGNQLLEYDQLGHVAKRIGSRALTSAPRNLYPTSDGKYVAVAAATQVVVERLAKAIGQPELVADPRFATNDDRLEHVEELDEVVSAWMIGHSRDEAMRILVEAEVPAAPVLNMEDLAGDPHLRERDAIVEVETDELGPVRMPGIFPRLGLTPGAIRRSSPQKGAANDEVYRELLQLDQDEMEQLRNEGVI